MRTNEQIFILFLVMLVGASTLSAQNKKEYNSEVVNKIITSKDYKISVDTYIPPYREYIELDYPESSIAIKNDSVFSDLFLLRNLIYLIAAEEMNFVFRYPSKNILWI